MRDVDIPGGSSQDLAYVKRGHEGSQNLNTSSSPRDLLFFNKNVLQMRQKDIGGDRRDCRKAFLN